MTIQTVKNTEVAERSGERLMDYLTWAMVILGVVARIAQFLFYRPLWLDENALAYNLVNRSFVGLLLPLDYAQAAPPGFLLLEKSVIQILGASVYTLRLIPLLAGIGSVFLVWALVRRVAPTAAPLVVGLFSSSSWLIYYSAEVKQYGFDVFVAAGLLFLLSMLRVDLPVRRWIGIAIIGAAAVWFSHPAIFVLAGGGIGLLVARPDLRKRLLWLVGCWIVGFVVAYLLIYRVVNANADLNQYWADCSSVSTQSGS